MSALGRSTAFTLPEVLIACLCVGLLAVAALAAASRNRAEAYTITCTSHLQQIAGQFPVYLAENGGLYPPTYVHASNNDGDYDLMSQSSDNPFGYVHWSSMMFGDAAMNTDLFQCPAMRYGGHPPTNPGKPWNWEPRQINQYGQIGSGLIADKQAERLAYVSNAAILPRNMFTPQLSGGPRVNVLVAESAISFPGDTILATEFVNSMKAVSVYDGSRYLSKTHRPINPFYHHLSGYGNEYRVPESTPGFMYGNPYNQETYGLLYNTAAANADGILTGAYNASQTNAVGRHHPGGDEWFEGTANFLFADGSVRRRTILQTLQDRQWGDRYYSITGANEVVSLEASP